MAVSTKNKYGAISINDIVIGAMVRRITEETFGVYSLAPSKISDSILAFFSHTAKDMGVKIAAKGNQIYIEVYIILFGAVVKEVIIQNLKDSISYNIEQFTGMRVVSVEVHTVGVLAT